MRLAYALLLAPSVALAQPPLSLKEAVELSLAKNPDIAVAKEVVAGAEAKTDREKARRYPLAHVNSSGFLYREPYSLPFGDQVFVLHERETTQTTVTVSQPLTGLAYLSELVGAAEHSAKAARADYDRARLDITYRTAEAYLHVLEARAVATVAHQSVTDIASELEQANKLHAAGTLTDIDVLRFQSAKAAADRQALQADTRSATADAALVVQIGFHDGEPIDVIDDLPSPVPPLAMTLPQAQDRAMTARPELRAAHERTISASDQTRAAKWAYFPDVRANATWMHMTGVQPFQPKDEEWLGVSLSWNIWDWGQVHHGVVEAEHAHNQARLTEGALGDQVKLDVRKRWLDAKTGFDSLAVAETQRKAADEAYRLQKVRFSAGAATTTDVLDAETEAARARLGVALARFDYYLALVALARSVGDFPAP